MLKLDLYWKNRDRGLESFVELKFKPKILRISSIKRATNKHTTWVMKRAHLRVIPFLSVPESDEPNCSLKKKGASF